MSMKIYVSEDAEKRANLDRDGYFEAKETNECNNKGL